MRRSQWGAGHAGGKGTLPGLANRSTNLAVLEGNVSEQTKAPEALSEAWWNTRFQNAVGDPHWKLSADDLHLLKAENARLREALEWFCGRVDKGEVRSRRTYKQFKELLARTWSKP